MTSDRIEKQVLLHATQERVWRAVSDSAEFGQWFGVRFDGPFRAGERLVGRIVPTTVDATVAAQQQPYEGTRFEITVERIDPMRCLSFRWHPYAVEAGVDYSNEPATLVTFELAEMPAGILLTITESGFDRIPLARRAQAFSANEGGWAIQVTLIERYLSAHTTA